MAKRRSCSKCHNKYPLTNEYFFKSSNRSDGFHSWCKTCCKIGNEKSKIKKYSTFEGRISTFLRTCKNSAEKRNNEFNLVAQDFLDMWEVQGGICAYTGLEMDLAPNTLLSVSVERIDNNVGYTKSNTILVCNAVNRMKSDLQPDDFFNLCKCVTLWLSDENLNLNVEFIKDAAQS